jgi:glycosyltransferase involved in cell wall biosynthesis
MMNPLVSIIVPAYNRASLIEETLESIYAQTYSPIELIVVDDGSADGTKDVVTGWMKKSGHPRCLFFPLSRNIGKSSAVNHALGHTNGDYVMIFDSDDVLLPDAVAAEVRFLQDNPDVGAVSARAYVMIGNQKTTNTLELFKDRETFDDLRAVHGDLLLKGNALISSTVLLRRSVVDAVGLFNVRLQYTHDWEYWIRVSRNYKIGFLARPVMYYRTNVAGALSLNRFGIFAETCRMLFDATSRHDIPSILKAQCYQTKYNAWLAYHDPNYVDMIRIFLFGGYSLARLLVRGKRK